MLQVVASPPIATATLAPAQAAGTNKHTLQQLLTKAQELGEQAGKGKDTQIKFLLSCVEGGYHGAVDLVPNKHGQEVDDATRLAEAYVKAQGTATVFDHKAANQRKLVSTLRTSIKLGAWPKGGNGEPLQTVDNLIAHRQKLRKDPTTDKKKLDDAANTFLRYARAQLKRDTLIEGDELHSYCYKPTRDPATAEDRVEALRNAAKNLIDGKGGIQDNSPKVRQAMQALTDRLVEIAKAKGKQGATV
jgi:plasmid stabilization system protein ParE